MYPEFQGRWKATCQRPITLKTGEVCMRMVFSGYTGNMNKLSEADKECLSPSADLWVDLPLSAMKKVVKNKHVQGLVSLRDLICETYPGATRLHEVASESVRATGKYPTSSIVRTAADDIKQDLDEELLERSPEEPPTVVKLLKKPTKAVKDIVGQFQPRQTIKTPIKGRENPVLQSRAMSATSIPSSGQTVLDVKDETPFGGSTVENQKIGFEPTNIREAREHITWPAWKAAMEKEVKGLLARGTWVEVKRSQVPANVKIMGSQFIFKDKITGAKARLVV